MDGLGWLIAVILLLLVGKNLNLATVFGGGVFTQPNAVPTPDGLPADVAEVSRQNTADPPTAQPAPWSPGTGACGPSPSLPISPVNISVMPYASNIARPVTGVRTALALPARAR